MQFYIFGVVVLLLGLYIGYFKKPKNPYLYCAVIGLPLAPLGMFWYLMTLKATHVFGGTDMEFFWGTLSDGELLPKIIILSYIIIAVIDILAVYKPAKQPEEPKEADPFK